MFPCKNRLGKSGAIIPVEGTDEYITQNADTRRCNANHATRSVQMVTTVYNYESLRSALGGI